VFERGVHIPPDAAARLVGLGRRLEPLAGSIAIRIVGYADSRPLIPGGPFKDNIELGMMRAAAVFDLLVRSSRLPPASFSLGSQGEAGTPFPQDEAHAGNNRTVVLTIARTDPGGPDR
jgi:flagellar motor protein MotB